MTAKEFIKSKLGERETLTMNELFGYLEEYEQQQPTKIDVSKEFVNLTTKYEEGKDA